MTDEIRGLIALAREKLAYTLEAVKRPGRGKLPHDYLVPGGPYEEQWDWDAFFMGAALASEDPKEAVWLKNWALNCLANEEPPGRVPGCLTPDGPRKTLYSMKPFLAQGIFLAWRSLGDSAWIEESWEGINRIVLLRERTLWSRDHGLALWHDSMESGADDNVAALDYPDRTVAAADANAFVFREYASMAHLARALGRTGEADHFRCRAEALKKDMNRLLWDEEDRVYYNLQAKTGESIRVVSYASFVPLWAGLAPLEKGRGSLERYLLSPDHMKSPFGMRSLSRTHPAYNNENRIKPHSNWQGPVWPIANYLYMHALMHYGFHEEAMDLARTITLLVLDDLDKTGGMHENYDAETGAPLAAPDFMSWNILIRVMLSEAMEQRNPLALEPF